MGKHRLSRRDGEQWGGPELATGSKPTRHTAVVDQAESRSSLPADDGREPTTILTGRPPSE